jgi:succinoglycan biosynthesis transport protein ExoP
VAPPAPARPINTRTRASDHLPPAPNLPQTALQAPPIVPAAAPAAAPTLEDAVADIRHLGEEARRIAVIGSARDVGTTLTAIALARTLARHARVILVDLAFASPNIDVISDDATAPGMAELVRGEASFGDIITRDQASRAHIVTAGQAGSDSARLLQSQMLWAALGALAHSYDYLVVDAGAHSEPILGSLAGATAYAVLVGGDTPLNTLNAMAGQLQASGFAHVAPLSGPPPALEQVAAQSAA